MKQKYLKIYILFFVMIIMVSNLLTYQALPGAIWGNLTYDYSGPTGSGSLGWINQGIEWTTLPGGITFTSYIAYNYRLRTKETYYYNTDGPSIVIDFGKDFYGFGYEYSMDNFREQKIVSHNNILFGRWYYSKEYYTNLVFSTWGKVSFDLTGITGSTGMGWIKQSYILPQLPFNIKPSCYIIYKYRGRTKERKYFDAHGPSAGIEFNIKYFDFGFSYYRETYPVLNETSNLFEIYLNWYYNWNLM